MDNYLLMGHILTCKVIPKDEVHPELWVGANRKWRVVPHGRISRLEHNKVSISVVMSDICWPVCRHGLKRSKRRRRGDYSSAKSNRSASLRNLVSNMTSKQLHMYVSRTHRHLSLLTPIVEECEAYGIIASLDVPLSVFIHLVISLQYPDHCKCWDLVSLHSRRY